MTKVYIIAEVGPNHNGSYKMAKKYIDLISKTDADAVKFQLANPKAVYSLDSFKANYQKKNDGKRSIIEMSKKNQLNQNEHLRLSQYAKKKGIDYMCSAFDIQSFNFLIKKIKINIIKIPSGEVFDKNILEKISKLRKKIYLSTGMVNDFEIKKILKIINKKFKKKITLLHCVSSYPANLDQVNLKKMLALRKFDCDIGFSDHTTSNSASIAAVALGATVIEKHVTINKSLKGPDHKFSSTIKEFKELVNSIREVEKILLDSKVLLDDRVLEITKVARKSIVTKFFIKKNDIITKDKIVFKRPGTGISPLESHKIIGKKAKNDIHKDRIIKYEMLI